MNYRTLGRTGLKISRIGLGGGGQSSLGRKQGKTEEESARVVKRAIELGINIIDTSPRNGTEDIIARGIRGFDRYSLVLSSKATVSKGDTLSTVAQFSRSLENSLKALNTPYIDILHFHGVLPHEYDYVITELLPVMEKLREQGKIRFIGLTEAFDRDRNHAMLRRALADDYWDVMMVGFNMLNQSARGRVFTLAQEKNIGILGMFAARRALVSVTSFSQALRELQVLGKLATDIDIGQTIERLTRQGQGRRKFIDLAYCYCRDEPAIHSVLTGTGDIRHLEQNVATFGTAPLGDDIRRFIVNNFGHISDFSGN